jgi:hypothetical protein
VLPPGTLVQEPQRVLVRLKRSSVLRPVQYQAMETTRLERGWRLANFQPLPQWLRQQVPEQLRVRQRGLVHCPQKHQPLRQSLRQQGLELLRVRARQRGLVRCPQKHQPLPQWLRQQELEQPQVLEQVPPPEEEAVVGEEVAVAVGGEPL